MSPKLITTIQKILWIMGWSFLMLVLAAMVIPVYEYFEPVSELMAEGPPKEFLFYKALKPIFSTFGQVFFAFLVSDVLEVIFKNSTQRLWRTKRFLILTCFGFAVDGLIEIINCFHSAVYTLPQVQFTSWIGVFSGVTYLLGLLVNLIPFVYVVVIILLYRYFSKRLISISEIR